MESARKNQLIRVIDGKRFKQKDGRIADAELCDKVLIINGRMQSGS